ncbi:hypothetical protein BJX64DRAFT_278766 [Aspergillus heterothallicus]
MHGASNQSQSSSGDYSWFWNCGLFSASKTTPQGWKTLALNTWFWETLAMLFSLLCFVAIFCILMVFEDKARPDMPRGFTLNAIVSILATASKSSLIYVIGECIGQLKWIWFKRKRDELSQMQLFDSAGRGPLGSLLVIMQHKGQSLQILTYRTRGAVDSTGRAVAKQAVVFLPTTFDADMQAIINTGVWAESPEYLRPNLTCSSGNCQWPAFLSVGICTECEDITAQTRFNCTPSGFNDTTISKGVNAVISCEIVPPQGKAFPLIVGLDMFSLDDTTPRVTSLQLNVTEHNVWSIFDYDSIRADFGATYVGIPDPQFVIGHVQLALVDNRTAVAPITDLGRAFHVVHAKQCAVGLCAREYNISVSNSTASFDILPPDYGERFINPESTLYETPADMTQVSTEFASCDTGDFSYINHYLGGTKKQVQDLVLYDDTGEFSNWSTIAPRQFETPESGVARILSTGLESVVRDVAASFTKAGLTASNFSAVNGTVLVSKVYVSVDLAWLALTLVHWRQGLLLWKSSILAVLFHGLVAGDERRGGEGQGEDRSIGRAAAGLRTDTMVEMERTAEDIHVKLNNTNTEEALQSSI